MATVADLVFRVASLQKEPRLLVAFLVQIMPQRRVGAGRQLRGQFVNAREQRQQAGLGIRRGEAFDRFVQSRQSGEQLLLGG